MWLSPSLVGLLVICSNQDVAQVDDMTPTKEPQNNIGLDPILLLDSPLGIIRLHHQHTFTFASQTSIVQLMEGTSARTNLEQTLFFGFKSRHGTKAMKVSKDTPPLIGVLDTRFKSLLDVLVWELKGRCWQRNLDNRGVVESLEEDLVYMLSKEGLVEEIVLEFALPLHLIRALWAEEQLIAINIEQWGHQMAIVETCRIDSQPLIVILIVHLILLQTDNRKRKRERREETGDNTLIISMS
jgi:hypothetical protein